MLMFPGMIHLHLDPLGGLAGDMFAACVLAAFPEHAPAVAEAALLAAGTRCRLLPHDDGVLAGQRFVVLDADERPADATPHARAPGDGAAHGPDRHAHHLHSGHAHSHADDRRHDDAHGHAHLHGHEHDHAHPHERERARPHGHQLEHAHPHEHEHADPHEHGHDHGDAPGHAHDHAPAGSAAHGYRAWREIRAHLQDCGLSGPVRDHAIGIFAVLAEAEARVHGKPVDAVAFHEVGAADSISDIVAAAVLIHATGAASWSVSALPLGGGRVRTAHGPMPVPAPATALLLDGFETVDDGIGGERVTPTGAAILAYLGQRGLLAARPSGRLSVSGIGFGTRRLPGISNCVRLLAIDTGTQDGAQDGAQGGPNAGADTPHRTLSVVCFEVDDQSGEDLAAGLDRVRAIAGVHDVVQMMAVGKKGRIATHVQVLAAPDRLDAVTAACFRETTTIGLRTHNVRGRALQRRSETVQVDGAAVSVKLVRRPDGETGKAEADHVLGLASHAARDERRRRAVLAALQQPAEPQP